MRLLVTASIPLVAIAAWVGWRALRGRPVRRFALNALIGGALLRYFAVTAGLGVFWVANQELPVFDLHYLFGYLTVLLVIAHVWINAPLLARLVKRATPSLTAAGRFRPSVASAARLAVLALFGGLCFWSGWAKGRSVVAIEAGPPATAAGSDADRAAGLPEQYVRDGGRTVTLARWYHRRSAHSRRGVITGGSRVAWADRPGVFEQYPALARIELPAAPAPVTRSTGAALAAAAEIPPALADAEVGRAELAAVLELTQGITEVSGPPGDRLHKRAAASSGALYPVVTHVVVGRVAGLAPGLYHYAPRERALDRLWAGDVRGELAALSARGDAIAVAPFALVLSSIHHRSTWKYGDRGYRYLLLDTGHALANAQAAGAALGLASLAIGRFDDVRLAGLLSVDVDDQGPMVIVPFGSAAAAPPAAADEPVFALAPAPLTASGLPDTVRIIAGGTGLRAAEGRRPPFVRGPAAAPRAPADAPPIELSPVAPPADPLGAVVARRRSERRFGDAPVPLATLAAVIAGARGGGVDGQRALRVHVVASRVAGLAPGAYEHRADAHALVRVRPGDLSRAVYELALSQQVAERAAAVVIVSADADAMAWPDGARGLRTAWIDAGVVGGRLYLQATALGLGVSSIGAFFDDEVVELLGLDPDVDLPALLVAVGARP